MVLLEWLAADYDTALILKWAEAAEWPTLSRQAISQHRKRFAARIDEMRKKRQDDALSTGLAVKAERVARLNRHADKLEAIKWQEDFMGKYPNEKAWRETVKQIAEEMDPRRGEISINGGEIKVYMGVDLDKV